MAAIGSTKAQAIIDEAHRLGIDDATLAQLADVTDLSWLDVMSGRMADALRDNIARHAARNPIRPNTTAPADQTERKATPAQVAYIMDLLARRSRNGEGGGFYSGPTTRDAVAAMTAEAASTYISSLKGAY